MSRKSVPARDSAWPAQAQCRAEHIRMGGCMLAAGWLVPPYVEVLHSCFVLRCFAFLGGEKGDGRTSCIINLFVVLYVQYYWVSSSAGGKALGRRRRRMGGGAAAGTTSSPFSWRDRGDVRQTVLLHFRPSNLKLCWMGGLFIYDSVGFASCTLWLFVVVVDDDFS